MISITLQFLSKARNSSSAPLQEIFESTLSLNVKEYHIFKTNTYKAALQMCTRDPGWSDAEVVSISRPMTPAERNIKRCVDLSVDCNYNVSSMFALDSDLVTKNVSFIYCYLKLRELAAE